jgi:hypothetical protein
MCGRPHGETVRHLGDGRWWDEAQQTWRDGRGRRIPSPALPEDAPIRGGRLNGAKGAGSFNLLALEDAALQALEPSVAR